MIHHLKYRPWLLILPILMACASSGIKKEDLYTLSIDEELEFGRKLAAEVKQQYQLLEDPQVIGYFNRLAERIGQNSDWSGLRYSCQIIVSNEIYHFALPGGHIYLTSGLIKEMSQANEAAGIIACEIAHIVNRNVSRQLVMKFGHSIFSQAVLGENPDIWRQVVAGFFDNFTILRFSDREAREADRLALLYLEKSKIDPAGLLLIYKSIRQIMIAAPERAAKIAHTHPPTEERVDKIEKYISKSNFYSSYLTTDSDFLLIKKMF